MYAQLHMMKSFIAKYDYDHVLEEAEHKSWLSRSVEKGEFPQFCK